MSESHYCVIHKTPFFKKGAMKAYAHPIKDENGETTGWCNEPKGQTKQKWGGKTPEELELSCRSYALSYAKDLAVAGKIEVKDIPSLATEFYNWMQAKPTAVKDTIKGESKIILAGDLVSETELSSEPITAEQKERLKELQEKLPGRALQLIKKWGWGVTTITKLTEGQAKHLIEEMEKEEPLPFG